MPDAGEGYQETGISLSHVLPEASGEATVRDRKLDLMEPWPDPAGLFLCSYGYWLAYRSNGHVVNWFGMLGKLPTTLYLCGLKLGACQCR